jgi:peptidoglycan/LPS O-acetylase OafA/YrhL
LYLRHHPRYRADIDGLRAVAVLAVVAYHAFPVIAPGGFVGVDVFFVISGYLITGLIVDGLKDGTFSFLDFYARRIKRIFPALLLVLASCLVLGWLNLLPDEFRSLGSHVFAGAGFWLNFTLYREAGYFDAKAIYKPLLHLWSLGIEEQFYLLWPLVAVLADKFGQRGLALAISIVVVSLAISVISVNAHPVGAFYLPIPRAWELLSGACLAYILPASPDPEGVRREGSSVAGCALILVSIFAFSADDSYPGWRAILPVAGTMLVISAGSTSWINRTLLSHPAAVAAGLISYPLYLWHWPAISFPEILGLSSTPTKITGLAISLGMAWATYRFLEIPVRRAPKSVCIWLIGAMVAVGAVGLLSKRSTIEPWSASAALDNILAAQSDWMSPPVSSKPFAFKGQTFWRDGTAEQTTLFIGDSNVEQYFARTHELIDSGSANLSTTFAFLGGCIPIPKLINEKVPACEDLVSRAFTFAKTDEVRTVVVAALWTLITVERRYDFILDQKTYPLTETAGRDAAFASLRDNLRELRRLGKRTVVILNIPVGTEFRPKDRIIRSFGGVTVTPPLAVPAIKISNRFAEITDRLISAAKESGSEIIDPFDYLCISGYCPSSDDDGLPLYKDGEHLRASFVRQHASFIDPLLRSH